MPERNTISIPAIKTNMDVPKSGCLAIRMLGISISTNMISICLPEGGIFLS